MMDASQWHKGSPSNGLPDATATTAPCSGSRKKMRAEIHFEDGDCLAEIAAPRLQLEVTRADALHAA
jgi:hypothetical protein